ncbi:unnamed protein product [Allacma fusca]|uniref:Uncharacterized protein n=1 Tax=Allacma fusca TaxID=39272 RepID=A0A8J2Q1H3_9HEXA|nr:unnamed protein product [Allacma fusca]
MSQLPPKIENEILDNKIEKTKQLFFQELARKKRNIKRQWMEINAVTNNHFLQLLPYRSLLNHLGDLTAERRETLKNCRRNDEILVRRTHFNAEDQVSGHRSQNNDSDNLSDDEFSGLPNELTRTFRTGTR